MDFAFNESEVQVREAVQQMLKRLEPRRAEFRRRMVEDKQFPMELWSVFAEAGLLGSIIPEAYGGTGMGLVALTIAMEELGAKGLANALLVVTSMDVACIVRNASEDVKKRFLPNVASGKWKLCFALTEPNAGSNSFRIETSATRDGSSYKLRGQKVFITGADIADWALVVARTTSLADADKSGKGKSFGMTLFLVPTNAPGLSKTQLPMHGIEGFKQFMLFFEDVVVPAENIVGMVDQGWSSLTNSLNPERILAAAHACGEVRFLLDRATSYAKERAVFGKPIGAHQALAHPLAEVRVGLDAAQLLTYRAAWSFDRNDPPAITGTMANMAKLTAADVALRAADVAIETHGGYGFSDEYEVFHAWDAMRLLKTAPVSREMILNFVAEHVLGLPRSY